MIRFVDLKTPEEERKMFAILTYHKKICAQDLGVHSRDVCHRAVRLQKIH